MLTVILFGLIGAMIDEPTPRRGAIGKFETRAPVMEAVTTRSIGDVERCLIDLPGVPAPNVYRQPDRPDEVTILWIANGGFNGVAVGRADLRRSATGTAAKLWLKDASARACVTD